LLAYSSFGFPVINLSTDTPNALAIWDNVFTVGFFVASFSIKVFPVATRPKCRLNSKAIRPFLLYLISSECQSSFTRVR
jgi:hypothetical protein